MAPSPRERRYLPGVQVGGGVLIDAGKSVFSLGKHKAFVRLLQPQKGRRLGSADVLRKAQQQLLFSANEQ